MQWAQVRFLVRELDPTSWDLHGGVFPISPATDKYYKNTTLLHATTWMILEIMLLVKEASRKDHILYDSIYMKLPE